MELNEKQQLVLEYVKEKHGTQVRKYTGEPYWEHLLSVAKLASRYEKFVFTTEIALMHDLLEDVEGITITDIETFLLGIGYDTDPVYLIIEGIQSLTDVYTKEKYPSMPRKERKNREARRLMKIPPWIQSIKYADIIDNVSSILEHDKDFARTYLVEKKEILMYMQSGNFVLYMRACATVVKGLMVLFPEEYE